MIASTEFKGLLINKVSIIDEMKPATITGDRLSVYYRLIALWVLNEAMLGGIIHGLRLPVSGLIVGSGAVVCICLIAWYVPVKGAILKATVIVAVCKMMLSPQAPPPAYIAVFFQGLMGEILFLNNKRFFRLSCVLLAVLALAESGLQRILVLTIIYGNDLWKVINDFINGLTRQKVAGNYSLLIAGVYVSIHIITGFVTGWWVSALPARVLKWKLASVDNVSGSQPIVSGKQNLPERFSNKKRRLRIRLFVTWAILIVLYIQSYFNMGDPVLPTHVSLKILIRSLIVVLSWILLVGPLSRKLLHAWLKRKQAGSHAELQKVIAILPGSRELLEDCWRGSNTRKGFSRLKQFIKSVLVGVLYPVPDDKTQAVHILSAPVGSGKTTSLLEWCAGRSDVHGIITPLVDGRRVFINISTREQWLMEALEDAEENISIGKYRFSSKGFAKAISLIRESKQLRGWLVIDEIGPLELRGAGFHDVLREVLAERKDKIVLVVREGLVEQVTGAFDIKEYSRLPFVRSER
jgi:nucleoside-triphosphatase THEP1